MQFAKSHFIGVTVSRELGGGSDKQAKPQLMWGAGSRRGDGWLPGVSHKKFGLCSAFEAGVCRFWGFFFFCLSFFPLEKA